MKIEPKAFIAIEKTLAATMQSQWDVVARGLLDQLRPLIEAKKWGDAQAAVNRLSLAGVVADVRPKIEEMCVSALLFGAHHATGNVKETSFAKGKAIPQELHNAIAQLEHMVEANGRVYVCNQLHAAIEAMKRGDAASHTQKHDVYTEPDKRPDHQTAEEYDPETEPDQDGEKAREQEKFFGQAAHQYKDDMSGAQLAETGGLQEPEQGEARPKRKGKQYLTKTEGAKTLYVHRPLLNAEQVIAWAKEQGFKTAQKPEDMHVTIVYSKVPFDWDNLSPKNDDVMLVGGERKVEQFGEAVVLTFESKVLALDNAEFMDAGASSDYPKYQQHVTITWNGAPRELDMIKPYDGILQFGPEVFAPINDDWKADHEEEVLKWERLFKADESLADKLNRAVATGGKVAVDTGAQLTTSRLVTLGFLAEAVETDVATYQVNEVLDSRTCPVCEYMNGKTFDVQRQYDRTIQQLSATDPDTLKTLAPWPGQSDDDLAHLKSLSLDELQANGYGAPPYHPGCRGMTMLVGSTTETIPLGGQTQSLPEEDLGLSSLPVPAEEAVEPQPEVADWSPEDIERLKWDRFNVTDPKVQANISDLIEAGAYADAQEEINDWKSEHVAKDESDTDEGFEGPNQPRKKRKLQTPAGREQDYDDISSDSSSIAFDSGVSNDNLPPIDSR